MPEVDKTGTYLEKTLDRTSIRLSALYVGRFRRVMLTNVRAESVIIPRWTENE